MHRLKLFSTNLQNRRLYATRPSKPSPVQGNLVTESAYINGQKISIQKFEKLGGTKQEKTKSTPSGVSMTKTWPGVQTQAISQPNQTGFPVVMSTLPNGLRVLTQESYAQGAAMALFVDSGVIYETAETHGSSHMLERMTFKATKNMDTRTLVREFEDLGGNITSSSSREVMVYTADLLRDNLPRMLKTLSNSIQNPLFDEAEVEETKEAILYEIEESRDKFEDKIMDILHGLAFPEQPLGRSMVASAEQMQNINSSVLRSFHSKLYHPNRMILSVTGAKHQEIVDIARSCFPSNSSESSTIIRPHSNYFGGESRVVKTLEDDSAHDEYYETDGSRKKDKSVSHCVMAWNCPGLSSPNQFPISVLFSLLGGGGSFSAGGPGKGMYSRLYRNVLNGYGFVESTQCFSSPYRDVGLFGVHSTVLRDELLSIQEVIAHELHNIATHLEKEEFERAKNQTKSAILMALESRSVVADDAGRQLFYQNKIYSPHEIVENIDALKIEDVQRVLKEILRSRPTMLLYGGKKALDKCYSGDQLHNFYLRELK